MNFLTRPDPAFAFVIRDLGTRLKTSQDNRTQRKNKTKQDKTPDKKGQDTRQEQTRHKTRPKTRKDIAQDKTVTRLTLVGFVSENQEFLISENSANNNELE